MRSGSDSSVTGLVRTLGSTAKVVRTLTKRTEHRARRTAISRPLSTGGFLGASVTSWIATSPSMLPRTWWMWTLNFGASQTYGYAGGVLAERIVLRIMEAIGLRMEIEEDHRDRARWHRCSRPGGHLHLFVGARRAASARDQPPGARGAEERRHSCGGQPRWPGGLRRRAGDGARRARHCSAVSRSAAPLSAGRDGAPRLAAADRRHRSPCSPSGCCAAGCSST